MGESVSFRANGGTANGYLASPASGTGPGIVVIQEWWGLNDQVKGVADMLAREGFNALAPDFYDGKGAKLGEPNEAQKLMTEMFHAGNAAKVAKGAAQYLRGHAGTSSKKVGVIGFCLGGALALLTASVAKDEIGAVVDCYGASKDFPDLTGSTAPVLGIFGGQDDHYADEATLAKLERHLKDAGVRFEKVVYPDAGHAFLNEQRAETYRPGDAKDAWSRIIPFLRTSLS